MFHQQPIRRKYSAFWSCWPDVCTCDSSSPSWLLITCSHHSSDVCVHIWQCFGNHSASLLGHGPLPHAIAACPRVHQVPPDSQSVEEAFGGILSACVDLFKWNRHEYGKMAKGKLLQTLRILFFVQVLKGFPEFLQADICLHLNRNLLQNCPAFKGLLLSFSSIPNNFSSFFRCLSRLSSSVFSSSKHEQVCDPPLFQRFYFFSSKQPTPLRAILWCTKATYLLPYISLPEEQSKSLKTTLLWKIWVCSCSEQEFLFNSHFCFLGKDETFGENPIETPTIGKSKCDVRALTYCDLHKITRSDLLQVLEMYPEFVESFNRNLVITYNLRDENQKGLTGITEHNVPSCKVINCFEAMPNCEDPEEG